MGATPDKVPALLLAASEDALAAAALLSEAAANPELLEREEWTRTALKRLGSAEFTMKVALSAGQESARFGDHRFVFDPDEVKE